MRARQSKEFVLNPRPVPSCGSGQGPCTGHADVESIVAAYCGEREDWDRRLQRQVRELTHEESMDICWPYSRNEMLASMQSSYFHPAWKCWRDKTHWEGDDMGYLKEMTIEELRSIHIKKTSLYYGILQEFVELGYATAEVDLSRFAAKKSTVRTMLTKQISLHPELHHIKVMERGDRMFLVDKDAKS